MRHLTPNWLIAHIEGWRVSKDQDQNEHIEGCPRCFVERLEWATLIGALKSSPLASPPEYATRNSIAIFERPKPASLMQRIVAAIVFDSAFAAEASGTRGAFDTRQVRLCGGDADMHLRISTRSGSIFGQIFETSTETFMVGVRIKLFRAGDLISMAVTDDLGEFRFNFVPGKDLEFDAELPSGLRLGGQIPMEDIN